MVKYSTARQKCRSGCSEFGRQPAQPLCNGGCKMDRGYSLEKKSETKLVSDCLNN